MATLAPQQQVFRAEWHGDKCKPLPVWSAPGRPPKRPRLPGSETAPSSSLWFKASRIHELERLALPDLFSGAYPHKTVEVYRAYRTAVLDAWKAAPPRTHITYTQVRRQMGPACDAATLLRVFRALEGWGLINHRTGQKPRFARSATMCEAYGNGESALRYVFDSSLLEPHQVRYSIASGPSDTTQGQKTRGDVAPPLAQTRFKCSATGVDCTAVRWVGTLPLLWTAPLRGGQRRVWRRRRNAANNCRAG